MSLEMSPCPSVSASGPHLINSQSGIYPPDPLPLIREGGIIVPKEANAPSGFLFTIRYQKDFKERG